MNHFISGIIKIILLEAHAGLLLLDRLIGDRFAKPIKVAFMVIAALMVFAWCNYGNSGHVPVHHWEQFHFYLGAKYQKEVGWFDLYKAAVLADAETTHRISVQQIRDNSTFELAPIQTAFADHDRILKNFGPERWEEFKRDWLLLMQQPIDVNRVVQDHGNSNSPAWSLIAHPIAEVVPFTPDGQRFIALLDLILMGVMWWFIWKTFGWKYACIGLVIFATPPNVWDYLGGSFLRWDWLFCVGLAICFMKREQWAIAGALFGYAVASKLFPLWFGVALGMRAALNMWREGKVPEKYRRFAVATVGSGAAIVLLSSAMFGGFWVWGDYKKRIDAAVTERFYSIQYSLRTVYLQVEESSLAELTGVGVAWVDPRTGGMVPPNTPGADWHLVTLPQSIFFPAEMKQARNDVDIADHQIGFKLIQLLFTAMVLLLILRTDEIGAFCLGPLLVFTWLIVNMYYWNMFALMAIGLARREGQDPALGALMGLHGIFMMFFLYQHTNHGMSEGYIVALQLCIWMITFTVFEYRVLRDEMKDFVSMLYGRKRA
jgi:hypothetical protein